MPGDCAGDCASDCAGDCASGLSDLDGGVRSRSAGGAVGDAWLIIRPVPAFPVLESIPGWVPAAKAALVTVTIAALSIILKAVSFFIVFSDFRLNGIAEPK
jgi:hypothetical protein